MQIIKYYADQMKHRLLHFAFWIMGFTFFLPSHSVYAQRPTFKPQVHEMRLQTVQLHYIPSLNDFYNGVPLSANVFNGLSYTYHISLRDGVRLGFNRRTAEFSRDESFDRFTDYEAEKVDWDLQLQYIRKLHVDQWQFYGGLGGTLSWGSVDDTGTLQSPPDDALTGSYTYNNAGGNIFVGMRYFFSTQVSVSWEILGYYHRTTHEVENVGSRFLLLPENESGIQSSLGISLHLVKMPKRCACPKVRR